MRPAIPAEMRREILMEAGYSCAVNRCAFPAVDIHHIVPFETCKSHDAENLIALCPNHHRMAHRGEIDRKAMSLYKMDLALRTLASPHRPGEERTRYCKTCEVETSQTHKIEVRWFFLESRHWECRCGQMNYFQRNVPVWPIKRAPAFRREA